MSAANTALFSRVHASTLEAKADFAASDSAQDAFPVSQWTGYAMPFASRTLRHGLSGHADYRGSSAGILAGVERNASNGFTWGLDAGLIGRHTSLHQNHNDRVNSAGFSIGTHAFYSPDAWNGFYIAGAARVGFDENHSKRRIAISDYRRTAKGHYTSVGASGLAALGKDFYAGNVSFGPIVTAEYGVTHREGFTERGGDGANLRIKGGSEDTFATTVGVTSQASPGPKPGCGSPRTSRQAGSMNSQGAVTRPRRRSPDTRGLNLKRGQSAALGTAS